MPVSINKTVYLKSQNGEVILLTETDQISENTDIELTCDSQRCASRHDGVRTVISWNVEKVKEDSNALSDDFYRVITVNLDSGNPKPTAKVFCSAGCARDFLQYEYVAPLSPREQALRLAQNQQVDAKRPPVNVIPFHPQPEAPPENVQPPAPTYQDPALDYSKPEAPACVGEQPACEHCNECNHADSYDIDSIPGKPGEYVVTPSKEEPLPELPSDVTPYDPDEVPF